MALSAGELTAIVIGVGNFTAWAKLFMDAKKNNGNGKACLAHGDLTSRITAVESIKDDLTTSLIGLHKENREDHQKIFEDIKGLSIAVAGAASAAAQAAATAAALSAATVRRRKECP